MNFTTKVAKSLTALVHASSCAPPLVFVLVASWLRACCYDHCFIVFEMFSATSWTWESLHGFIINCLICSFERCNMHAGLQWNWLTFSYSSAPNRWKNLCLTAFSVGSMIFMQPLQTGLLPFFEKVWGRADQPWGIRVLWHLGFSCSCSSFLLFLLKSLLVSCLLFFLFLLFFFTSARNTIFSIVNKNPPRQCRRRWWVQVHYGTPFYKNL